MTTSGTSELYGADNGVLRVDEFETIVVQSTNLERLTELDVVDVNNNLFRDGRVNSLNLELLHAQCELTTCLNTFSVTFKSNRNFHNYRLGFVHFEEVDVKDFVGYRVELDVL